MFNNKIKLFVTYLLVSVSFLIPGITLSSQKNHLQKKQVVSAPEESIKPQNQIHSDHPQTKGIILHFHRWPNDAEEKTIKDWARQVGFENAAKEI